MSTLELKFPKYAKPLFENDSRYNTIYGGRGSGKSYLVAECLLLKYLNLPNGLALCGREYQNSIKDSVHSLLHRIILDNGLSEYYKVKKDEIVSRHNNSKFIFKGVKVNIESIKSTDGITDLWLEEAASVSRKSWDIIRPTVRESNSKIWSTFNPRYEDDVIYQEFVLNPRPDATIIKANYYDNPFFPAVLEEERKRDEATLNRDVYNHIWLGECVKVSDAQIFKDKFYVEEFEIDRSYGEPLYGMDFGFSVDAFATVEVYIKGRNLYVRKEAYKVGLELDHTVAFVKSRIKGIEQRAIRADSSRPDTISYLKRAGLPLLKPVDKGAGSVEDGIAFIKSFDKIIIHPSCTNTLTEFQRYSYKTDSRTSDITTIIIDAYNHSIDALRYALRPFSKSSHRDYHKLLYGD